MNNDIKLLPSGDFEVIAEASRAIEEIEDRIKRAMMIPAPLLSNKEFEKGLPGVKESDFFSAPPGIADDMPEDYGCILCDMGVPLVGAQPQQHQPNPPSDPVGDFVWAIVKLRDGKEYWLKKLNEDGTREWTPDNTQCRLWHRQSKAEQFITDNIGEGQAGVRGLLVGG